MVFKFLYYTVHDALLVAVQCPVIYFIKMAGLSLKDKLFDRSISKLFSISPGILSIVSRFYSKKESTHKTAQEGAASREQC